MRAKEFLEANQLSAAITELNQDVKRSPTDTRLRTFLFELLCFAGEYDRAERQLDVIGLQSEQAGIGVEVYRQLLRADKARQRWFSDGLKPAFLLEPPPWVAHLLEAGNRVRGRQTDAAKALLQQTASGSKVQGTVNGTPFAEFRDSDDRLGPILEVYLRESYAWLPYEQINKIVIPQPKQLRDLLWTPATIEVGDGPSGDVFLPVLYVGSSGEDDDKIRLGKITDWRGLGDGLAGGVGQKTFLVDDHEVGMLEIRNLAFHRV